METKMSIPAAVKTRVSKAVKFAGELSIKTNEDFESAGKALIGIKQVAKSVKEAKEKITKPLLEATKNARDFFRPFEAGPAEAEKIIKTKMADYSTKVEAEAKKKEDDLAKKVEKEELTAPQASAAIEKVKQAPETVKDEGAATYMKEVKKVVIEDEALLPREYLVPNTVLINKDAKAGKEIPGVKVNIEKEGAVRT